ncbi:MAG TPA: hypothetical protein VNJ49_10235 [Bradyrhizobium sp.]|nr:hypothetical protein [Bradyrhizobium sp.]
MSLKWVENDGPAVRPPTRRGFGTKIITRTFQGETGWSVNLDYDPLGLRCTMRFYLEPQEGGDAEFTAAAG